MPPGYLEPGYLDAMQFQLATSLISRQMNRDMAATFDLTRRHAAEIRRLAESDRSFVALVDPDGSRRLVPCNMPSREPLA
jgi:hypothetical protein